MLSSSDGAAVVFQDNILQVLEAEAPPPLDGAVWAERTERSVHSCRCVVQTLMPVVGGATASGAAQRGGAIFSAARRSWFKVWHRG